MNTQLKNDLGTLDSILQEAASIASSYYSNQISLPPSRVEGDLEHTELPTQGKGALNMLRYFAENYAGRMANSAGPRYFGFVTGGSTPASVAGDWLVSVYDQVMSGSNDSVAHGLERQTIGFLRDLFGLSNEFTGTFVTGATMSNFVSLAIARQWLGDQYGIDVSENGMTSEIPVRIVSATPHSSIFKSLSMLGFGRKALTLIETLPGRESVDIEKLDEYLTANSGPVIVVANAGTVNTVDFDDLNKLSELKRKHKFFLHIDAAFGGFAAVSPRYQHLVDCINVADTITIDAHKWLNVPYDAAMQFTRHRDIQVKVFQNNAAYLGAPGENPDNMHLTPENSRRFRALPAWFSLMAYGRDGYRDIIERNCDVAATLGKRIEESEDFRLLAPVRMNVVCFSFQSNPSTHQIGKFLSNVRDDGRVFFTPTVYKGVPAIRAAVSNWRTTIDDAELAFNVLCEVYQKTAVSLNKK